MRALLLIAMLLVAAGAEAAKYKCKDRNGNWSEEACTGAAAPPERQASRRSESGGNNDALDKLKRFCAGEWPSDFSMQKHCMEQQLASVGRLAVEFENVANDELRAAQGKCVLDWEKPGDMHDWVMVEHCWKQQKSAYDSIK